MEGDKKPRLSFSNIRKKKNQVDSDDRSNSPSTGTGSDKSLKSNAISSATPGQGDDRDKGSPATSSGKTQSAILSESPSQSNPRSNNFNLGKSKAESSKGDEDEIDITEYIGVILRRRNWVIGTVLLVVVMAAILRWTLPVKYASMARLLISSPTNDLEMLTDSKSSGIVSQNSIMTHIENLRNPNSQFLQLVNAHLETPITLAQLNGAFTVTRERDADVLQIRVISGDSIFATRLANAVAKGYEEFDLEIRQHTYSENEKWIEVHLKEKKALLSAYEEQNKTFMEQHPKFGSAGASSVGRVVELEKQLNDIDVTLGEMEERERLNHFSLSHEDSQVVQEVTYDRPLEKELLSLELELARLKADYGEDHRKVKTTLDKMISIKELILKNKDANSNTTVVIKNPRFNELTTKIQDLKAERAVLLARKSELEKALEEAYRSSAFQPELELEFSRLSREKESAGRIFALLGEKLEETRLKKSSVKRGVIQLGRAEMPNNPEPHKLKISFGLSVLLGLALGILLSFAVEFMDRTIKTPLDVEKKIGLPILGVIPGVDLENRQLRSDSNSKLLEPYRTLRTNLSYTSLGLEKQNTLIITSALQGEGKTTKAVNLAVSFALDGKKVLVVDADLRRAGVHSHFGLNRDRGFSDYLTGQLSLEQVLKSSEYHGLKVVTAGMKPPNPPEILGSRLFDQFLREVESLFDLIIFDSPAILPVSDALVIAPKIKAGIIVFRTNLTPIKAGQEIYRQLQLVGTNILGGILNAVPTDARSYYYYGYYGYAYYQTYYEEGHRQQGSPLWDDIKSTFSLEHYPRIHSGLKLLGTSTLTSTTGKRGAALIQKLFTGYGSLKASQINRILNLFMLGLLIASLLILSFWAFFHFSSKAKSPDFIPFDKLQAPGNPELMSSGKTRASQNTSYSHLPSMPSLQPSDSLAIQEQVQIWATGLGSLNFPQYFSTYSPTSFIFSGGGFDEWRTKRYAELIQIKTINLKLKHIRLMAKPKGIESRFEQMLTVNDHTTRFEKILLWQKEDENWLIVTEKVKDLSKEIGASNYED